MKYFTPDLIKRMNARDMNVVTAALEEWEGRLAAYERRLKAIWPRLPRSVKRYLTSCRLHDADFRAAIKEAPTRRDASKLSLLIRQGNKLFSLRYALASKLNTRAVLPAELRTEQPVFLYDEMDSVGPRLYEHRVLLSTGEELTVRFRKFQLVEGHWLLPAENRKLKAVS